MHILLGIASLSLVTLAPARGGPGPPRFVEGPTAARQDSGVRIEFTVDQLGDVAVTVEDAKGRVVRHLVAGVLGENPPPPLERNSLAQSIIWPGQPADRPGQGIRRD